MEDMKLNFQFYTKKKLSTRGDKINKITGWFSNRSQMFQHGFIAGVQFPYGFNVKFKYYMSEFHNQNFTESNCIKPYSGLESHIMYYTLYSDNRKVLIIFLHREDSLKKSV